MLLNVHSWFSLNHGVLSPEQVLQEAHALGVQQLALTDINCTAGWSDLFRLAPHYKVRPLAGIEFRRGPRTLYTGIARTNTGVHQLASLLSDHLLDGVPLPEHAPEMDEAFIVYPWDAPNLPQRLRPNEHIGVSPGDVNRLRLSPWMKHKDKLLALVTATFRSEPGLAKRDHNVHRLKRAVDTNTLLSTTPAEQVAPPTHRFLTEEQVCAAFAAVPELVWNTRRLMDQCEVHFAHGRSKNRRTWGDSPTADLALLRKETLAGLQRRFPRPAQHILDRVERELTVIAQKDFVSYFLINWDLVRFAKHKGFFHVGRGSGANSLVAYCLGITDVDPIALDLYFERFINPGRSSPPDFDLDFSWKDRDQVTRHLFDTYGHQRRVALLATYSTYQQRAVVRELGKVFGLPPSEIDALAEGDTGRSVWIGRHAQAGPGKGTGTPAQNDRIARSILHYAQHFHEHPHHLSIHVGGVLISEKPLTHYTAVHLPPKGFATTQFSMLEAEDLGLHKFDILSQRGLGHIRDAVELVGKTQATSLKAQDTSYKTQETSLNDQLTRSVCLESCDLNSESCDFRPAVDIHAIERFKHDPRINDLLRTGDTIGCFYVESPAMRMLLRKLDVQDYPTLVAASSIIRPGVSQSGMMREYILRHRDPERREQAHPAMAAIMPDTYGVMVYQEDVIKVAHLYAGLTLAEADILRRGMSGKYRSRQEFQRVQERFFSNCRAKGHPEQESAEIWRQIESFAGYSFAKGHSASYAVESYQSLYLKAYHPLEFMVAVVNNFGGFYHTEFYLHEAKRAGAVIEAPCINRSGGLCTLVRPDDGMIGKDADGSGQTEAQWELTKGERDDARRMESPPAIHTNDHTPCTAPRHRRTLSPSNPSARIFLGLRNIASLEATTAERILTERQRHGLFADLPDLLRRVPIAAEQARILIRSGALRFTGRSKPQLLWDLTLLHRGSAPEPTPDLFAPRQAQTRLPSLEHHALSDAYDELELLGFPLCDPFLLVENEGENGENDEGGKNTGKLSPPHTFPPPSPSSPPPPISARDMPLHVGRCVTMLGYVVHVKPTRTGAGDRMSFGCFIDRSGDLWDSTQFPAVEAKYPFRGRGVYRITGTVEEEFGHCTLNARHIEKLPWRKDPRYGAT